MDMSQSPATLQSKKGKRRQKHLELKVVLDTNQLYTGSASDLLKNEVARLIEESKKHDDVHVSWYVPDVVKRERRYQMLCAARELLPALSTLERLLGHGLNITPEILEERVDAAINKQANGLDINILALDSQRVNWDDIVTRATDRKPPFAHGKHEKGFRDAVIAETFVQLVHDSPKSSAACRLVFVTGDALLAECVGARVADAKVHVLTSLEHLQDLINLVVSDVKDDFINLLRDSAKKCFFEEDDKSTLYYKAAVGEEIVKKFAQQLAERPIGATERKNGAWCVGPNRFSHKVGQRIHWIATISVEATSYSIETVSAPPTLSSMTSILGATTTALGGLGIQRDIADDLWKSNFTLGNTEETFRRLTGLGNYGKAIAGPPKVERRLVASGKSTFEVGWSASVTAEKKLVKARVESFRHVETVWGKSSST